MPSALMQLSMRVSFCSVAETRLAAVVRVVGDADDDDDDVVRCGTAGRVIGRVLL